ncbi:peptide-methionine (R)-S-oxide reductase MsrB [Ponticaulis koreensis]|uniref:peptide-methionine (R)-S-oxide reductase MsrB n=1 Tax=Ponticaulis koreensis TaxID=1123045 RepID=UPI0003B74EA4|nr:peptide-methionine (R)-S-oxide reductase MsrB [Ponticaulis koreensis]
MTQTPPKVVRSDEEWKSILNEEQYRVGVKDGTERAFTPGNYQDEKRDGDYHCVGCDTVLWQSDHKFESGTGWPSFFQPASEGVVDTKRDFKMIVPRTECHCAVCGLHQGHVFKDGPPPTGLRWCINGAVLNFVPRDEG